jgi:CelD/BcsL family acetyltransferase involved in cellulose biosynthesis
MQVELYDDAHAFDVLREEWDQLLSRSYCDTLFLRPAWLGIWWEVFGREGALRLATARDERGRLVGVAPLFLAPLAADPAEPVPALSYERPVPRTGTIVQPTALFVGGTEVSDYLDFVVERGQAEAVYRAFFDVLQREAGWEWIDLHCLPGDSPTPDLLGRLAREAGHDVALAQEDVCPVLALPASWREYLSLLSKKDRHELRRKMRRVAESGVEEIVEVRSSAELDSLLPSFLALHEASAPDKADFMQDPRMRTFFRRVAQMACEHGWLDLSFLALDGQLAASLFCFRYGDSMLVYNSGFDPDAWPGLSPGVALFGHRIRQAIESGVRTYDFMQGNERYKYDLGAQDRPIHRLFARRSAREG